MHETVYNGICVVVFHDIWMLSFSQVYFLSSIFSFSTSILHLLIMIILFTSCNYFIKPSTCINTFYKDYITIIIITYLFMCTYDLTVYCLRRRRIFAKSAGVAKKVARGHGFTSELCTTVVGIVCAVVKSFFCKQV